MTLDLADKIFTSTDLKQRQSEVFRYITKNRFATIRRDDEQYAIINREQLQAVLQGLRYATSVLKYLTEVRQSGGGVITSVELPWARFLDKEERGQFEKELLETVLLCASKGKWEELVDLFEDWQATAEAKRHPDLIEAWTSRGKGDEYTTPKRSPGA